MDVPATLYFLFCTSFLNEKIHSYSSSETLIFYELRDLGMKAYTDFFHVSTKEKTTVFPLSKYFAKNHLRYGNKS